MRPSRMQDDGRRDHGARKRPAAGFVDARHRAL